MEHECDSRCESRPNAVYPVTYINLEYHPNDSRIKIIDEDVCQTLSTRMGTGGGNVPLIIEVRNEDTDREEVL